MKFGISIHVVAERNPVRHAHQSLARKLQNSVNFNYREIKAVWLSVSHLRFHTLHVIVCHGRFI